VWLFRYHGRITWRTYTPDGRPLEVEHTEDGWVATCNGVRELAPTAAEAIRAALGDGGAAIGVSGASVEAWIAEHAALLEQDVG
jgi:hypothetical protein